MNGSESTTAASGWFGQRRYQTLRQELLQQGLSAHQLALAVALGATIGILPTLWGTSLICFLLAWLLRLNHLAVQTVNYLVYPLQIFLFVPFSLWGQALCTVPIVTPLPCSWQDLQIGWQQLGTALLPAQLTALAGWATLTPAFLTGIYFPLRWALRLKAPRKTSSSQAQKRQPNTINNNSE